MKAAAEIVAIGRVVKPQGRHGELLVEPLSDRPDRFASLKRVYVGAAEGDGREMAVSSCWPHKGRFVLKLEGVESIDEAERLRDLVVGIGTEELPELPADSYYHHELVGLRAELADGTALGRVAQLIETGAVPVLAIETGAGETLVPLAKEFVRRIDTGAGRLVVVLPRQADPEPALAASGPGRPGRGR